MSERHKELLESVVKGPWE